MGGEFRCTLVARGHHKDEEKQAQTSVALYSPMSEAPYSREMLFCKMEAAVAIGSRVMRFESHSSQGK